MKKRARDQVSQTGTVTVDPMLLHLCDAWSFTCDLALGAILAHGVGFVVDSIYGLE